MVSRRKLLAGVLIAGGGYYGYNNIYATPQTGTSPPEFLGDPITFSGTGSGTTGIFTRENNGPLVLEIETENSDGFLMQLVGESTGSLSNIYAGSGNTQTTQIHNIATGEYRIRLRQNPANWAVTIKNYPAVDPSHRQVGVPPIEAQNQGVKMVGPLALNYDTPTTFEFEAETTGEHIIEAYDRRGISQQNIIEIESTEPPSQTVDIDIGGTGYFLINSSAAWELSVTTEG